MYQPLMLAALYVGPEPDGAESGAEAAVVSGGVLRTHARTGHEHTGAPMALAPQAGGAPRVRADVPPKVAGPPTARPVPAPAPGRSTQQPPTPRKRQAPPIAGAAPGAGAASARGEGRSVVITHADGTQEIRTGGSRAWRNNNPGNIENGRYAGSHGSLGGAGGDTNTRFAVFANRDAGFNALQDLLASPAYRTRTLNDAIDRWAPPVENDTDRYRAVVRAATGLSGDTRLGDMSAEQREAVARAIGRHEGWQPGSVTYRRPGG